MKIISILILFLSISAQAYVEQKVQFPIDDGINLSGYMSAPDSAGNYPIFVLQMGHGKGTTDSEKRSYNPFAKLARAVADAGFLVLRFDKRGTGYNEDNGSFADGTFTDYVADLEAAVRYMQGQSQAISNQVYLFGHSLGGPVISFAALDLVSVKGIILSASPGRHYADFNLEQIKYLYELGQGMSGQELEKALAEVEKENSLISKPKEFCTEFPLQCEVKDGNYYLYGQSSHFWNEINQLDPIAPLLKLNCNIHSIHGTSDWVISSENDGGSIQNALSGNSKYSFSVLPKLDHFLTETESKKSSIDLFMNGLPDGKAKIHPDFIPEVISTLTKWNSGARID